MTSTTPASIRGPWLAADDKLSATEALGVLGVVVWGGALVWVVVSEILRVRSKSDGHGVQHGQHWQRGDGSGRSQERPR